LGVKKLQDFGTGIGFSNNTYGNEEAKKQVLMKEMKNFFSPEFLNRIDDTIVFNSLSPEDIKKVADYGEATNLLAYQLLDYFSKTKGAISDTETALFRRFSANETKTPAENLAILRMAVEIDTRNQRALSEMNRQKITDPADQRRFLEQYAIENPLDFSQLESVSTAAPQKAIFDKADQIIKASAKPTKR
jgi:hypothetical protein